MADMNPDDAAAFAQGDLDNEPATPDTDAGGSIVDRLFDGGARGPNTTELAQEYGFDEWSALVVRGVLRAAPGDGMPPVGDISIGGMLGAKKFMDEPGAANQSDDGGEGGEW